MLLKEAKMRKTVYLIIGLLAGAAVGAFAAFLIARQTPALEHVYDWIIDLGERLFLT